MNAKVKSILSVTWKVGLGLIGLTALVIGIIILPCIARWKSVRSPDTEVRYIIEAPRGNIYDANGNLIATSKEEYDVHLDCAIIQNSTEWKEKTLALAPQLAALLPERGAAEWWDYLQDGRKYEKRYLRIAKGISPEKKDALSRLPIFDMKPLEGGAIYESYQARVYPYDSLARRTIGYTRPAGGLMIGIEGKWDNNLRGTDGCSVFRYNRAEGRGNKKETARTGAVPGADLQTTLSMPIQLAADSVLRSVLNEETDLESGCLILMEVHTGAIRAMVNLSKGQREYSSGKAWERFNCAIASLYEPGEVLQTMTLASVLRDGYVRSLDETVPTNHGILPDYQQDIHLLDYERSNGADSITVKEGFAQSSKYVFGKLATDYYSGSEVYYTEGIGAWCLPNSVDFDVDGFRQVDITHPEGLYWNSGTLPSMANGHGLVMAPLDILSFYNTIANRGDMVQPYLVETIRLGKETLYQHMTSILKAPAMTPAVADTLAKALRYVTADGTGKRLQDAKAPIAGKTGTALQILNPGNELRPVEDPYHDNDGRHKIVATYAGFFPAEKPQYSVICALYSYPSKKTFFGGTSAGQVVKDLVNKLD